MDYEPVTDGPVVRRPEQKRIRKSRRGCYVVIIVILLLILIPSGIAALNTYQHLATNCTAPFSSKVALSFYYGSEKADWMNNVLGDFSRLNPNICVSATPIGSGTSMQQILDGSIHPDVWSPAGSVWLTLANAQWQKQHGSDLVSTGANDTPSLVSSPVVIALWKPMAEALGWPTRQLGWSDFASLSTNPQGWAAYGHPEFGTFKFGHTHPAYSNSGLDAIIAMNYAALNKTRGLTLPDVQTTQARTFVSTVERSVIHYGESTGFFADQMFSRGPSYLSAAVMYENLVVQANDGQKYPHLASPVVAIYPKEGTFYSDHPFAILQGSWMTPQKRAAAQKLRDFLLAPAQQHKALQDGFRPASPNIPLAAPLDRAHGVDPGQPTTVLPIPAVATLNAIQASWEQQRRRVDVMLILDHSGSMEGDALDNAKKGLAQFVSLLSDSDQLGLTQFSDNADVLSQVGPLGPKRQDLLNTIDNISADGGTRIYDTINEQVQALKSLPDSNIKAVVVLTDGDDNASQLSVSDLIQQITPSGVNAGNGIKVFTIAYGSDANQDDLTRIAQATGGEEYAGSPDTIKQVYFQISQFF